MLQCYTCGNRFLCLGGIVSDLMSSETDLFEFSQNMKGTCRSYIKDSCCGVKTKSKTYSGVVMTCPHCGSSTFDVDSYVRLNSDLNKPGLPFVIPVLKVRCSQCKQELIKE